MILWKPCKNYWIERGLILSPARHWEPSFVFALFLTQRCKWGWEIAQQESNLITNMTVILGCFINVVQLYHCYCMTMLSAICSGWPSQAAFWGRHIGREDVFREYPWWSPDFSRKILNSYPNKSRLLGTLKSVFGLSRESVVCVHRYSLTPGRAETCFFNWLISKGY